MDMSTVRRRITAIITCSLIVCSATYGALFVYGPVLPLMFIWPKLYRRTVEIIGSMWQSLLVAINEKIFGIGMVFTGDGVRRHEKTIMLLNHRTRLDWFFFFSYVYHSSLLNRHKIALKAMLRWFPGVGWAMQADSYIFLDRKWETDKEHIRKILKYQIDLDSKPNILFFPEGTDLTDETRCRSNEYAKKNDLEEYEFVLQPRTKGFCFFVNTLRQIGGINYVHDVTVGYPHNIAQGEGQLVRGEVPRECHFHFVKYSIDQLPRNEAELSRWIRLRWKEKEERLKTFYSHPDPALRRFPGLPCRNTEPRSALLWTSLVFWSTFNLVFTVALIQSPMLRLYGLLVFIFYLAGGAIFGGVDKVELLCYEFLWKPYPLWAKKNKENGGSNPYAKYFNR